MASTGKFKQIARFSLRFLGAVGFTPDHAGKLIATALSG
jgi:hypothetical protein